MTTAAARTHRVLVVEDDPAIAAGVVRGLKAAGFEVSLANDGERGLALALEEQPDLVVLDLMLPGRTGFELLEAWRGRTSAPVVVLTAKVGLDDRLKAFDLGAADFVAKPFFMEELVARVKARLRLKEDGPRRVVSFDDVTVDLDARAATRAGEVVPLTQIELNVLAHLVERPGRAVTRAQLARAALPVEGEREERTVDSHVARVRKKLGAAGQRIATVWGIGYRFDPPKGSA